MGMKQTKGLLIGYARVSTDEQTTSNYARLAARRSSRNMDLVLLAAALPSRNLSGR